MRNEWSGWFRVIDPLNPLFGCDVEGDLLTVEGVAIGRLEVRKMRRVDITVGDRPFQLVAPARKYLGVTVDIDHLERSPLQDETVELDTSRPFGRCIDESEMTRRDGVTLRIARYENAVQIAIEDADNSLVATETIADPDRKLEETVVHLWEGGAEEEELAALLKFRRRD